MPLHRHFALAVVLLSVGLVACDRAAEPEVKRQAKSPSTRTAASKNVSEVSADDAGMKQAMRFGQESLEEGFTLREKLAETQRTAMRVKLRFDGPRGQGEYMWVHLSDSADEGFTGLLLNEPLVATQYKRLQEIDVQPELIVDWAVEVEDGSVAGDLTTCYIALKLEPRGPAARQVERQPGGCDWAKAYFLRRGVKL